MESNFSLGKDFNYGKDVSLTVELNKVCYSPGEILHGTIILTPKQNSQIKELLEPYAKISFQEKQNYEYLEAYHDKDRDIIKPTKKLINEIIPLGTYPFDFSSYINSSLFPNLKIPFEVKVPINAYPTCLFEPNCYVITFLTVEFESLKVKQSFIIIIKNNYHFTAENGLLKSPGVYKQIITKHKFALLSCGYFELKITLEKNICPYNDNLPIIIDIDCSNLSLINIKAVKIYIYRGYRKNTLKNKKVMKEGKKDEIVRKTLPLNEGEKMYHIEDGIKLPISSNDLNPEAVYKILDSDKKVGKARLNSIKLFPSCNGGLLSCQYFIKIVVETNTLFSTNEEMIIPVDFYSPFKDNNNDNTYENININNNSEQKNIKINLNDNSKENQNEIKNNVDDIDSNLNINQQKFINDNKPIKDEDNNKNKKSNNISNDYRLFGDDDDNDD